MEGGENLRCCRGVGVAGIDLLEEIEGGGRGRWGDGEGEGSGGRVGEEDVVGDGVGAEGGGGEGGEDVVGGDGVSLGAGDVRVAGEGEEVEGGGGIVSEGEEEGVVGRFGGKGRGAVEEKQGEEAEGGDERPLAGGDAATGAAASEE